MVLVAYSDSEGSDTEETSTPAAQSKPIPLSKPSNNFTIDKANPSRIRVNLTSSLPQPSTDREDGEPAAKRARIGGGGGGGAFSGFNAMLPAPKRDDVRAGIPSTNGTKPPARKVFSLKTGAEPAFSRDGDAELRDSFAEQEYELAQKETGSHGEDGSTNTIPNNIPKPQFPAESTASPVAAKPFMFKPLSVSRGPKKKKAASQVMKGSNLPIDQPAKTHLTNAHPSPENHSTDSQAIPNPQPKLSLFSSGPTELPPDPDPSPPPTPTPEYEDDEIIEILDEYPLTTTIQPAPTHQPETLTSLATTLNLTHAQRRQLLGRKGASTTTATGQDPTIITFNTDTEYASNQEFNASADASVQHNPVRAIAGGKHSLKQLVASAQGQKEALEESFAAGRRNKREAGSKYGW